MYGGRLKKRSGTRTFRRTWKRRRSNLRGATVHLILARTTSDITLEPTIVANATPIIWPADFSDRDYDGVNVRWQGAGEFGVYIGGGTLTVDIAVMNYSPGVMAYARMFLGLAILNISDPLGNNDPTEFVPDLLPNLFCRNYGTLDSPGDPPLPSMQEAVRCIHRQYLLLPTGEENLANNTGLPSAGDFGVRRTVIPIKKHRLGRRQGLFIVDAAYGGGAETGNDYVLCVGGTFGYRLGGKRRY